MPSASDVRGTLGSTDLSDTEIQRRIEQAERMYDQRIDSEPVEEPLRDDVVEYLACHLVKSGPEPEVTGGDGVDFRVPDEGRFYAIAVRLDPTGQLAGDEDEEADHFTLGV
jgi:hypothetical protein